MSRILLINPNRQQCSDIKFLLHLNGYQIECCDTINEGINRYQIFQELDNSFNLVLIVAGGELLAELQQFSENPFAGKLIIVHSKRGWKAQKKPQFSDYAICDPELVLDCVKYHLKVNSELLDSDSGSPERLTEYGKGMGNL